MTMNNSMRAFAVLGDAARAAASVDSFTARAKSKLCRLANKRFVNFITNESTAQARGSGVNCWLFLVPYCKQSRSHTCLAARGDLRCRPEAADVTICTSSLRKVSC